MLKQAHLYIKGDVIGVGFRAWVKIQAKINNIKGWVKNVFNDSNTFGINGGVEAQIQGEEIQVNKIVEIIKKGSPISRVEEVEIIWQDAKEIFNGFEIIK